MIAKVTHSGSGVNLFRYLIGEGKPTSFGVNVHENPHVISGDDFVMAWHGNEELNQAAGRDLAGYLDRPRDVFGVSIREQVKQVDPATGDAAVVGYRGAHLFHCSLSVAAEEGPLAEERWDVIAREFMDEMGFTDAGGKAACRWVAVHHGVSANGNDHIHIAASMVREDGTRWGGRWRDFHHAQQAARTLEARHGLRQLTSRQYGTADRGVQHAERQAANRASLPDTARQVLAGRVRSAAVGSRSEAEWIRRLRGDGVVVKPYFAAGSTDVVTGYKVALKPDAYAGRLVFYGGGRLGRDLSLPRLRERWANPTVEDAAAAGAEWQAAFRGRPPVAANGREAGDAARVNINRITSRLVAFNDHLAQIPVTDRDAWAHAARDVSGTLAAWSRIDPDNADDLNAAAAALARSAQNRRPAHPARQNSRNTPAGIALLLLQAARSREPDRKARIAAALFLRQLIRTADAIRSYHAAVDNNAEAARLQRDVIDRLRQLPLAGYPDPSTEQRILASDDRDALAALNAAHTTRTTASSTRTPADRDPAAERPVGVADVLPRRLTPAAQRQNARDADRSR